MKAYLGESGNKKLELPFESLKKHFIALGSSGSGKTVLVKALVEETAERGIPSVVLDLQGDLSSLAIRTADKLVKNKIVIYTPSSSKGIPLSLNPLKFPKEDLDEEEKISLLNQVSLNLTQLIAYKVDEDRGRACQTVLYKLLEHCYEENIELKDFSKLALLLDQEASKLGLYEFASKANLGQIVRKLKFLTVGGKNLMFHLGAPLDINEMMQKDRINIIYLNTLHSKSEKEFFISSLCAQLYDWMLSNPSKNLQALFVLDEIAPFIPSGSRNPITKPALELIFKQARKYGVGCVVATQNPGDIDYKAFAQFGTWAVGRLTLSQDRKKIKNAVESLSEDVLEDLPSFKPGEFILFSPDNFSEIKNLKVRWLYTDHKTLTEEELRGVMDEEVIREFDKSKRKNKNENGENRENLEEKGETHFKLNIYGNKLDKLIKKYQKTPLFGSKESLISCDLMFEPIYKCKLKSLKKGIFKKSFSEDVALINALTGNFVFASNKIKDFVGVNKMLNLSEREIEAFRSITESRKGLSSAELALKLKIRNSNHLIKSLNDKKMITKSDSSWHSLVNLEMPKINYLSSKFELSNKEVEAKLVKPKISLDSISPVLRAWYSGVEVVESSIIYNPVYKVTYADKKGRRTIRISGYSGEKL